MELENQPMTPFENRELRGITNKLVITILFAVVSIVSGGFAFYNGLMSKIDGVAQTQEIRKVEVDYKLNAINSKADALKEDIQDIKEAQKSKNN